MHAFQILRRIEPDDERAAMLRQTHFRGERRFEQEPTKRSRHPVVPYMYDRRSVSM
jgi:hypothetical protein